MTKQNKIIQPFIGVTGFTDQKQVRVVAKVKHQPDDLPLAIGVLATLGTIKDPNKIFRNRFALGKNIANIFDHGLPNCINTLHYYSPPSHQDTLLEQMLRATELAGPNLNGIQLNIPWPDPKVLATYQEHHPNIFLILVVGKEALETAEHSAVHVSYRIQQDYKGLIDYTMIDASEGGSIIFNQDKLDDYFIHIRERNPDLALIITGGMSSSTVQNIVPLVKKFKNLSIDAEGRLRNAKRAGDLLILAEARNYFKNSQKIFRDHRH